MKEIKLTKNKVAMVDDEDYKFLKQFKWQFNNGYACTRIYMHQMIMKPQKGKTVDHKNMDGLDNRKENLRNCTYSQNRWNRLKPKNNTSGYKGVHWSKPRKMWKSHIKIDNGKYVHLGYFTDIKQAALAYNKVVKKYHGEFARLNEITV